MTNSPLQIPEDERRTLSGPGLRTFERIADVWNLTEQQRCSILGLDGPAYFRALQAVMHGANDEGVALGQAVLERISHILGIFKAINILMPVPERADEWMRKSNSAPGLEGRSAIDLIANGNLSDLAFLRTYLQSQLT